MNKPKIPKFLSLLRPATSLQSKTRYLLCAALALGNAACGDDETPEPPERGLICVNILDQSDQMMQGCDFDYEVSKAILDEEERYQEEYGTEKKSAVAFNEEACGEGQLLIYGKPGQYKVDARCGKLAGYADVDLDEGKNEDYETRLIGSLCSSGERLIADPQNPVVNLLGHVGRSDDLRCRNWLDEIEARRLDLVKLDLKCEGVEGPCKGTDGDKYLMPLGEAGESSNGKPKHFMLEGKTHNVPKNEERTVGVTLRESESAEQELEIPVVVKSAECGNDIIESGETCEGENFHNVSCEDLGFAGGGELSCNEMCQRDTSGCQE